jgi:hypothetical protein
LLYERYGDSGGIAQALVYLLPPARLTSEISTALFTNHPVDGTHLLWLLGYGVVCFALGAAALRYRQLGS